MPPIRAVFIGALNLDQLVRVPRLPRPGETVTGGDLLRAPGGKASNQAVAAARLGASVTMIGRVGRDPAGRALSRSLRDAGVSTRWVRGGERPTGTALIFVDERGENAIAVSPGANAEVAPADIPWRAIASADVVVASLEAQLGSIEAAFRLARGAGVRTVLNAAPSQAVPRALLEVCDVVICNETELASLLAGGAPLRPEAVSPDPVTRDPAAFDLAAHEPDGARRLRAFSEQVIVVTLGAGGALAVAGERVVRQPAFDVRVVDTVGAGDAFVAGFVVGRWFSSGIAAALRHACAAGSLATTRPGAQPSMPTLEEVQLLLESAPRRR
jgi:ribokinase